MISAIESDNFDENVASVVVEFQEKHASEVLTPAGLKHGTGYVGAATRAKLNKLYGCANNPHCENLWWYDNTNKTCSQKQFCGMYMYFGLKTFASEAACRADLAGTTSWMDIYSAGSSSVTALSYGSTYTLKWSTSAFSNSLPVYINDITNGKNCYLGTLQNTGTYTFTLPKEVNIGTCSGNIVEGNKYNIVLGNESGAIVSKNLTVSPTQPLGVTYFYSSYCPHCVNVDNYLATVKINLNFTKLNVNDSNNQNLLKEKAVICGVSEGIPFIWDGSSCIVGDINVINFFKKYAQPSITVTSPNGGEKFVPGSNISISWINKNFTSTDIHISLVNDKFSPREIATYSDGRTSAMYTIASNMTGFFDNGYRIMICEEGGRSNPICAYSNYFTISSAAACNKCPDFNKDGKVDSADQTLFTNCIYNNQGCSAYDFDLNCDGVRTIVGDVPVFTNLLGKNDSDISACAGIVSPRSITVISPNGGEKIEKGKSFNVLWKSQGVSKVYIQIYYYNDNNTIDANNYFNSGECRLTYEPVSADSGSYTIEGNFSGRCGAIPIGNKIKVKISGLAADGTQIEDFSDNYFTIVAAAPVACNKCPDFNKDGKVDSADQTLFTNCIYNNQGCSAYDFDLNCDGVKTIVGDVPVFTSLLGKNSSNISACQ